MLQIKLNGTEIEDGFHNTYLGIKKHTIQNEHNSFK